MTFLHNATLTQSELREYQKAAFHDLHVCVTGLRAGAREVCGEPLAARVLKDVAVIRSIDRTLERRSA